MKTKIAMKKIVLLLSIFACIASVNTQAQVRDYRSNGYHGNIGIVDYLGVYVGAETSHGVMIDRYSFLGLGVGLFVLPNNTHPTYLNAFADYHIYLKDNISTPVLGIKAGVSHSLDYEKNSGIQFENGVLIEPSFSWSWGMRNGKGLTLGLGMTNIFPIGDSRTDKKILPLPKISFEFVF